MSLLLSRRLRRRSRLWTRPAYNARARRAAPLAAGSARIEPIPLPRRGPKASDDPARPSARAGFLSRFGVRRHRDRRGFLALFFAGGEFDRRQVGVFRFRRGGEV